MTTVEPIRHRLSAAVRFVDAFTSRPVGASLDVRVEALPLVVGMPAVPWRAVRGATDDTYRLRTGGNDVPLVGVVDVAVTVPGGEYAMPEPLALTLPLPMTAHPPTPAMRDYLVQHPLWPTRALRLPPGETAVVARLRSAGATTVPGLRVTLWPDGTPQPAFPYAYADADGTVVYRLPALKTVVGGVPTSVVSMRIAVTRPPAYVTPVAPTQIQTDAGLVLAVPFTIQLGRPTGLLITLP